MNLEKIWSLLKTTGPLCDDCLSLSSDVKPRQTVNIICRKLKADGSLKRQKDLCPKCGKTKIINSMLAGSAKVPKKNIIPKSKPVPGMKSKPVAYSEGKFPSNCMKTILMSFCKKISDGKIEIYNEFSLQHEIGILLRNTMEGKLVQFERNISFFGFSKDHFEKREIDIVVYQKSETLLDAAIELKFPKNGQYPEQMFSFCKDVVFMEQLKRAGFNKAYLIIFAEDRLFYEGEQKRYIWILPWRSKSVWESR